MRKLSGPIEWLGAQATAVEYGAAAAAAAPSGRPVITGSNPGIMHHRHCHCLPDFLATAAASKNRMGIREKQGKRNGKRRGGGKGKVKVKEESIRTMGSVVNDRCVGERGERGRRKRREKE